MDQTAAQKKKTISIFAPAKINLYLHVTGKLSNGYHTLDSLACFTDIGDHLHIEENPDFKFIIDGPFAGQLSSTDRNTSQNSTNLVVRAALTLCKMAQKNPALKITLTKNLPVAAGLGSGSSNAASTIWGIQDLWNLPRRSNYLPMLLKSLGADVPACMDCRPVRMRGIGEILDPVDITTEIPIVIVNPLKFCRTQNVFLNFQGPFRKELKTLPKLDKYSAIITFLKDQENDLLSAATQEVPEIQNCLGALQIQTGCDLARMSGSGASCFGLFEMEEHANSAAKTIQSENPDWWVTSGWLNRTVRY